MRYLISLCLLAIVATPVWAEDANSRANAAVAASLATAEKKGQPLVCECGPVCGCRVCGCEPLRAAKAVVTWERPRMGDSLRRKDTDGSMWAYSLASDVWQCCDTPVVHALPLAQYQPTQLSQPMMSMGGFGGGRGNCSGGS